MTELTNSQRETISKGLIGLINHELEICAEKTPEKTQIKILGEFIDYGAVKGYFSKGVTQELIRRYNDLVVERGYINDPIINNEITKIQEGIDKNLK